MNAAASFVIAFVSITAVTSQTPWEAFLELPSPENAAQVDEIRYSSGAIPADYGYLATDLDILSIQVLAGDAEAFRLTYRLRTRADGALLEELEAILSRTIRVQPMLFLAEVASLRPDKPSLERILLSPGLEYVERPEARRYEIMMRRRALSAIKNAELQVNRDYCLALMKDDAGI